MSRQPTSADDEDERERDERGEHGRDEAELLRELRARRGILRNAVYKGTMHVLAALEDDAATRIADTRLSPDARALVNGSFVSIRALRLNLLNLLVENAAAAQPQPMPEGEPDEGTPARELGRPEEV